MDANANPGPINPDSNLNDIARPGPIDPATGQPSRGAEVSALKTWIKDNLVSLVVTALVIGFVLWKLDPIDTLKVVLGLGLVIFIHELGHFVAAKWCDVHVRTFSIGFGPAVPFCSYKWGETTYMVGIIPLGGYVSMVGEGDNAGEEDAEEDPRSFRHKSVGQRMLIISAGVIMNVILGMACFVAAYLHGVQEKPATIGWMESGGAAWRAGMRTDDDIVKIGQREKPYFNDIRPIVMSTLQGEKVDVWVRHPGASEAVKMTVEPLKDDGVRFPQVGIAPPYRLTLLSIKKKDFKPVIPGSKAAEAGNPGFEPGDRIIGMSNPDDPARAVTPLKDDPKEPSRGQDINDYYLRMSRLVSEPVTFRVQRKQDGGAGAIVDITVAPAYRADLGVRMRMGKIAAVRAGSPAEAAQVQAVPVDGPPTAPGDRIVEVTVTEPGGGKTRFTAGDQKAGDSKDAPSPGLTVKKLDPVLLPLELKKWADRNPTDLSVKVVVLRAVGHKENERVELTMSYDRSFRHEREAVTLANSPLPVGGLGLAYWVEAVVDEVAPGGPAADAGLQPNDKITAVRFHVKDDTGELKPDDWEDVKPHQWASADVAFQSRSPRIGLKVERSSGEVEVTLEGRENTAWPVEDRGLVFQQDFRIQKATDVGDAIGLGAQRTMRFIKEVYMHLYAMIFGRVSPKTMSGPLTIGNVAYRFAGEDFWQFLLFIGMISVNLAVVNFLPIPVLDGGHMVFLILEKILGRPVPERVFAFAMYAGLAMILSLMVYVISRDIGRLFFGWL